MMKLLNIYLNHFPSHEKHGLALKVRSTAYDMYDYIVEAQKRYHKKTTLTNLYGATKPWLISSVTKNLSHEKRLNS